MKYSILIALLCSCITFGQDCNLTFSGQIIDFHNGETITDATLQIESLNKNTITDSNGKFSFNNLCEGKFSLIVSHVSCETKTIEINLTKSIQKTIYLEHHIEELEVVALKGENTTYKTLTAQKEKIDKELIDNFSSESLGSVLKQVSGVTSINTGNKIVKPVINGLHSSRITIVNNGVRMEDQEWGIEHAPNIDINSAESITIIKGSSALAYSGDAIGGIVILKPQSYINKDTLFGNTIAGFQSNGKGYNINSSLSKNYKSGWFANGNVGYKQNGDLEAPDYNLTNTGAKSISGNILGGYKSFEYGIEANISYIDNTLGILSAAHIGNVEDLVNAINSDEPLIVEDFSYSINSPKQEVSHFLGKLSAYKRFSSLGKLNIQYDYQNNHRLEFDKRVGDDRNKPAVDLELTTHNLKADLSIDKFDNYRIYVGMVGKYQENFANPDTGVRRLIPDYEKYDFGIYGIVKTDLNDKLTADLGVRYDFNHIDALKFYRKSRWDERGYEEDFNTIIIDDLGTQLLTNPLFNYHNISISTGLQYILNESHSFTFNYGLSSRPPNASELFSDGLHHSAARIELGDLRLDKEISNRFGLNYNATFNKLDIKTDLFLNHIKDFIYLKPTGTESTIRGAFPVWEFFKTDALMMGADITATYQFFMNWNFTTVNSYVYGENTIEDIPLIDIPSFRSQNTISYSFKKWNQLNLGIDYEFVAKQNRYPKYNFETYIPTIDEFVEVDISTPPPSYNLFHISSDATFSLGNKTNVNVRLGINNIFNTSYREYLNRLRYFTDDTGRNITIQLKFNY